jgi:hypothetical protein
MFAFRYILVLHILAGASALLLLWVPLFARKGGTLHRRVGWMYVVAMGTVACTALALATLRLTNGDPTDDAAGLFLGHVAVLTGKNVFAGMRALRHRRPSSPLLHALDWGVSIALAASSLVMAVRGATSGAPLPMIFAVLGMTSAVPEFLYLAKISPRPNAWLFRHLTNMVTSGIAAITAFLVVNAPRFGVRIFNPFVWTIPALLGALGIAIWSAHYRRKFAGSAATSISVGGVAKRTHGYE